MAIRTSHEPVELWNRRAARVAGVACMVLGLAAAAGLVGLATLAGQATAQCIVLAAAFAASAAVAAQILRGQVWAQRLLLVFWLLTAAAAAGTALAGLLWDQGSFWTGQLPAGLIAIGILAASCAAAALLVHASAEGSRLRYGSMVAVSIAAAVAVAVVVNLIAQKDPLRKDFQMLGMWGLSDRTKTIVHDLDSPVRLTCLYTPGLRQGTEAQKRLLEERRARVWELLEELHEQNRKIEVQNLTTDLQKADLLDRLRKQLGGQADKHEALLMKFRAVCKDLAARLSAEQRDCWAQLSAESYLGQWGWPADIGKALRSAADSLSETSAAIGREMAGLPDYGKLTDEVKDVLEGVSAGLQNVTEVLSKVEALPKAVQAGEKGIRQRLDAVVSASEAMVKAVGTPNQGDPLDPAGALKQVSEAAGKVVDQLNGVADALENVAGAESAPLLLGHRGLQKTLRVGGQTVAISFPQLFRTYAQQIDADLRRAAQGVATAGNAEYQKQFFQQLRKNANGLADFLRQVQEDRQAVAAALVALKTADEASRKILQDAASGALFKQIVEPVADLLKQAKALPALKAASLSSDVTQDNIVLLEAGEKLEVASFDDVWPLRSVPGLSAGGVEEEQKRLFNGDAAIGSRLLKMTNQPFATVVLTYLPASPELRQIAMGPEALQALRKRLEDANFLVETWDLTREFPDAEEAPSPATASAPGSDPASAPASGPASAPATATAPAKPQKVLLVLPPAPAIPPSPYAPPSPAFSAAHVEKIRRQTDRGTPAIFLVGSDFGAARYGLSSALEPLNDYLRKDWGIEVLASYRLIAARRDASDPDRFRIDLGRFWHLPLSNFTDHPIGKPLQGQRMLWQDMCPIAVQAAPPEGVTVRTVLEVPRYESDIWATRDILALFRELVSQSEGLVSPQPGDLAAPLTVAVAATRTGKDQARAGRIAVLAIGPSMRDGFLDEPVPEVESGATVKFADPPRADADVVVNSVYWLIGRQGFIAAGPAQVKPVARMNEMTQWTVRWACILGLPLAVIALGAIVLLARRS